MSNVLSECSMHNGIIPMQEPDRLEIQAPVSPYYFASYVRPGWHSEQIALL